MPSLSFKFRFARPVRLTLLAFVIILLASVSQHEYRTARAQTRHVGANVIAWQTLKAAQRVPTTYQGSASAVPKLQSGAAVPLAMVSADFDSDGVADLVIGYAHSGGGILALHRGNLDAFSPQSYQSWQAIGHEQFPSPFLQQATVIDLPEAPDFLVTGDFSGSGHVDILTGARGSGHLYLLAGTGKGKFSAPQPIALPGALTSLAAGKVGVRDGKTDAVVGVQIAQTSAVLVYKGSAGGLSGLAVSYPVPQAATQLEIADLHGDGFSDIAALSGSEVLIIHPTGQAGSDTTNLVERVPTSGSARSIAVGGFVMDRHSRNQLAVLSNSGVMQILSAGALDTRPFTAQERLARRSAALRVKLPSEFEAPWSGQASAWQVIKTSSVSAPMSKNVRLTAVSLAHSRPLDLMVVDSSDTRVHVVPANTSGNSADEVGELTVETGDAPAAVLPMRVNHDGRPGLVIVGKSVPAPATMAPLPDPTFTVNRLDDPAASVANASTYCNGGSNDCSLRQAVIKANSVSGSDTIMLPAGTITLTITGQAESASETGSLDVLDSLTITGSVDGSGNPTSIIQGCGGTSGIACTGADGATAWNDNFITVNKLGVTNANLSVSNVIFQNGNNTNLASTNFGFDALGGAVLFFGCGTLGGGCANGSVTLPASTLMITNVQFFNNSVGNGVSTGTGAGCSTNNNIDCGGGLISQFGDTTISNSSFFGNTSTNGRGGGLLLSGAAETMTVTNSTFGNATAPNHSATEGGGLYIDFQNSNGTGNISIHSSTFSGNTAGNATSPADAGGIFVNFGTGGNTSTATIDQGTVITGNTASRGGGISFSGITSTVSSPGTTSLTVTDSTITGNHANGGAGGGGAIHIASGGMFTVTFSRIVHNTTAASGAPTGIAVEAGIDGSASTVNAADNWWGCNSGPSAAPCDTVATVGNGTSPVATVSPWLVLTLNANPTAVQAVTPNNTSSLKADFLHDSAAGAVSVSNIGVLLGLPITFGANAGSISGAQTTIQPDGTATATFTHDATCNASSATATVDTNPPPTVTTAITILCPDLSAIKSNSLGASGVTTPLSSATWNWTINVANSGASNSAPAIFPNGQTILTDNLPNSPTSNITYGTATLGGFSGITNSGSISCGITGSVLTCSASGADVTIGVGGSFQVTFQATVPPIPSNAGEYNNPASVCQVNPNGFVAESDANSDRNNNCHDQVIVVAPPGITKAFSPASIPVNGTSTLSFNIINPGVNTVDLTGVAFTDFLPTSITGSVVVAGFPNVTTIGCGGGATVTATAGSGSISLTGATVAAFGSCKVFVNVTSASSGIYPNITGVTSTNGGTGQPSNTAILTVANPPSISKAFGAASVPLNGTTSLTLTIANPNSGISLSGISFTDTLPSGLVVSSPSNLNNTCNGAPSGGAGSGSVSLSGGTIPAGGTCMLSVNVTGTTAGVKNNTTGSVTSTEGGTGNSASAALTVAAPPIINKAFGATSLPLNGTTSLSFTIGNPNFGISLSGISFTDSLPSGLVVSTPNNLSSTCGGTATAAANSGTVSLSAGTIAPGGTCALNVNVTGTSAGAKNNTTSPVTSTEGGTGNTASATLTVVAPPTIAKVFSPTTIPVNGTSTLTFAIINPAANTVAESGVAFSDTLTTGLVVATPNGLTNACGGTASATAGSSTINFVGGSVAINSSCTISVNVQGTASGNYTNTTGAISSTNGGTGNTATANLTVASPPIISKAFGATTLPLNGTTSLSFSIANPNSGVSLSGISFTDTLPSGLVVSTPNNLTNTCNGAPAAGAGSGLVILAGGTIAPGGTCTLNVNVTGTTVGVKNNTTGSVTSTEGGTGNTASAAVTVEAAPVISKAFGAASIPLPGGTSLTFTITNPNPFNGLTGIGFVDSLPTGLSASTGPIVNSCNGAVVASGSTVSLSGGTIPAGASCSLSVPVTGTTAGAKNNTAGPVTSTEGGTGAPSNTATLIVVAPPVISKAFSQTTIPVNGVSTLAFAISNPAANTVAETGVAFSDTLPAGLVVATPNGLTGSCGGTATAGSSTITLAGGTVATNSSCTITVNVTGTTSGVKNNTTSQVSSANGGFGNTASATLTVASPPSIGKSFAASSIAFGSNTSLSFAITNPNPTMALTGVAFTDSLPSGLIVASIPIIDTCGGTVTAASGSISLSGGTLAGGGSCSVQVGVTGAAVGTDNNTTGPISANETGPGTTSNTATIMVTQAPTTSSVTVAPTSQEYSDQVTFTATLSPAMLLGQAPATSVTFKIGTTTFGPVTLTASGGSLTGSVTAPVLLQPNPYTVSAVFGGVNSNFIVGSPSTSLTITKEVAVVTPSTANPMALQVSVPGGTSPAFTLSATIQEEADSTHGDINNAKPVTISLIPVGPGSPITCTATVVNTGGPTGFLTASCPFSGVPVNVYDVMFTVGGNYYQGSAQSVLIVFDPSLGFVTGGGTIIDPNTGFKANFGLSVKYNSNGQPKGSMLFIEHQLTRDVIVKSNALAGLAIVSSPGGAFPHNEAIITGKAVVNGIGNISFQATAIDDISPGSMIDQFGLHLGPGSPVSLSLNPVNLNGGDIHVPH